MKSLQYPSAKRDSVTDNFFGYEIKDPFRWMEDPDSSETLEWTAKQSELTSENLSSWEHYPQVEKKLKEQLNYTRYGLPTKIKDTLYYFKRPHLENQPALYKKTENQEEIILNPNELSEDGTTAITCLCFSDDGEYLAYGIASSGSDRNIVRILNLQTMEHLDDVIQWINFPNIAWKNDNSGFYYNRFPQTGSVPKEDENNYCKIYYHSLNTPQTEDTVVFEDSQDKEMGFNVTLSEDNRFLILSSYKGCSPTNRVIVKDLNSNGEFRHFFQEEARYWFMGNKGNSLYFKTNLQSPNGKIIRIALDNNELTDVIQETSQIIEFACIADDKIIVCFLEDVISKLKLFSLGGEFIREIPLPGKGTVAGFGRWKDSSEVFFQFSSFLEPVSSYCYDIQSAEMNQVFSSDLKFDKDLYETRQVFYHSKDKTQIPMFLTYKKGISLNKENPVILYGYGGFGVSIKPSFSAVNLHWLERGGIYAVANLRGGDEYGEEWHQAGWLLNKQNVFDDFIYAAKYLIQENYTSPGKIAISGRSNGGLLVGACMLQAPELFGAALCGVPVLDMFRYHKFTVGRYWIPEYGSAEQNEETFLNLKSYSPLHNVVKDKKYPPVLILTADHDDRVVPAHALKFCAELQCESHQENIILLRVEKKAGHGAGKPLSKTIEEYTDIYSFLFQVMNIQY